MTLVGFGPLLVGTLAWGVLAFGAVYPWAYWPLLASSAALGLWSIVRTRAWRNPRVRRLAVALGVLSAAILVQTVALPYWLLGYLSPGVDRFFHAFTVGYHPASLHALSLAPEATWAVLAEVVALSLLLIGVIRALRHTSADWIVTQLMGLGVALSIIGIIQKALGGSDHVLVYGFWQPLDGGNPFGPFVNRNHFAGWMAMTLPVVVALALGMVEASDPARRRDVRGWLRWAGSLGGNRAVLVSVAALVMGAALVLTGSRSGIASFAVGMLALGWFVARHHGRRALRVAAGSSLVALVVAATLWAGSDMVLARFERAPDEIGGRLGAWRDTSRMIGDFPVFGVGLGSYRTAMLHYQTADRQTMYGQAHNDYLQLVAEGGLLVTIPAAMVLLLFVLGVRRRFRAPQEDAMTYWLRRGAVAGLVGIGAQSLVEFSLQMPGNAVLFVVLAGIAFHRPASSPHARRV